MDRLGELELFVEVLERGDYSSAARALGLTPSAVSKAIKRLEQRLGAHLFDRTSRAVHPTADGDALYEFAKKAIASVDEAENAVAGSLRAPRGDLRILSPPTFAIYQLARVTPKFRQRHPDIRLSYILRNAPLDFGEHRIDVAIAIGRPPDSDHLLRRIGASRYVFCASPDYLRQRGTPKTVADLTNHDCLGYALDTGALRILGGEVVEADTMVMAGTQVAADNGSMLQALARVGAGVVRLAEYHVAADLAAGRLVRIFPDEPAERQDIFAVYPRKLRNSARVRAFVDFLHEQFNAPTWNEGVRLRD